jgi:alpha-mannosidase
MIFFGGGLHLCLPTLRTGFFAHDFPMRQSNSIQFTTEDTESTEPEPNQSNKSTAKDAKKKSQISMTKNTVRSTSVLLEFGHWDLEFFLRVLRGSKKRTIKLTTDYTD